MTVYGAIVLIHVISAVVGMGPAFLFPMFIKFAKRKNNWYFIRENRKRDQNWKYCTAWNWIHIGIFKYELISRNMVYCFDRALLSCTIFVIGVG